MIPSTFHHLGFIIAFAVLSMVMDGFISGSASSAFQKSRSRYHEQRGAGLTATLKPGWCSAAVA
jgi:hypothetical protein